MLIPLLFSILFHFFFVLSLLVAMLSWPHHIFLQNGLLSRRVGQLLSGHTMYRNVTISKHMSAIKKHRWAEQEKVKTDFIWENLKNGQPTLKKMTSICGKVSFIMLGNSSSLSLLRVYVQFVLLPHPMSSNLKDNVTGYWQSTLETTDTTSLTKLIRYLSYVPNTKTIYITVFNLF